MSCPCNRRYFKDQTEWERYIRRKYQSPRFVDKTTTYTERNSIQVRGALLEVQQRKVIAYNGSTSLGHFHVTKGEGWVYLRQGEEH